MDYKIPIEKLGDGIKELISTENLCSINLQAIFWWFLLPCLIGIFLIFLIKYRPEIRERILMLLSKRGYIRIYFIKENKRILHKLVKLDKFSNFTIGKRKYNLEKMYNFLLGYDKYNFPVFLYDFQFIIPLKVTAMSVTKQIKGQLGAENISTTKISAITMKLDSSILKTVYDKKLISDLYSISGDSTFKNKIFWVIVIVLALVILYYTGYMEKIMGYLI